MSSHEIPHNRDLEVAVLQACCFDRTARQHSVVNMHAHDFYDADHRKVWQAIVDSHEAGEDPDYLCVASRAGMGVGALVAMLPDTYSLALDVSSHCERLAEFGTLRKTLEAVEEGMGAARRATTPEEGNDLLAGLADKLRVLRPGKVTAKTATEAAQELWDALNSTEKASGLTPMATGIAGLDQVLAGGFRPGQLIVLGARPGCGKSALACNTIATSVAESGKRVFVVSLEMPTIELVQRIASAKSGVLLAALRRPDMLGQADRDAANLTTSDIASFDMHFADRRRLTVQAIAAQAQRLHALFPISLIIVDYIQIVKGTPVKGGNREQEVAEIVRELKSLAVDLGCAVLALSQLNRQSDEGMPKMSDLRESGSLEQDADVVLLLGSGDSTEKLVDVPCIVAKHRGGSTGRLKLIFDKGHTHFIDGGGAWQDVRRAPDSTRKSKSDGVKHTPGHARAGE
jgi:replicative DNA helicase